jgi:SNF2 family DNA or RNA helicase
LPFILRREKEQVLQELPPKTITIVRVAMSELQSKIYHEFCTGSEVRKSLAALNAAVQGAQSGDDGEKAELNLDLGTDALKALLFLRLLCTHPFLVSPDPEMSRTDNNDYFTLGASGKILALAELLRDAGIYRDELQAQITTRLFCTATMIWKKLTTI